MNSVARNAQARPHRRPRGDPRAQFRAPLLPGPGAGPRLDPLGTNANSQGEAGAEISTFDPATKRAFVTNAAANSLDVFDLSDPTSQVPLPSVALGAFGGLPNSVDFTSRCGGLLAVAMEATEKTDSGTVELFDVDGNHLDSIGVGAQPDMLIFHQRGKQLLVANEGEPADDGSVDPPGSVSVIDLKRCLAKIRVRTAGFAEVPTRGPVRIFGPGAGKARDLEPEYIASAGDRAWVTIQEANAIGILDLDGPSSRWSGASASRITGCPGMPSTRAMRTVASTSWRGSTCSACISPDAIAPYAIKEERRRRGKGCGEDGTKWGRTAIRLVTANEGDSRDWEYFSEEARVSDLNLDPDVFDASAGEDQNLGRLTVTTTLGDTDDDGEYEKLYAFGGRSMSVLESQRQDRSFDTRSFLELLHRRPRARVFQPRQRGRPGEIPTTAATTRGRSPRAS